MFITPQNSLGPNFPFLPSGSWQGDSAHAVTSLMDTQQSVCDDERKTDFRFSFQCVSRVSISNNQFQPTESVGNCPGKLPVLIQAAWWQITRTLYRTPRHASSQTRSSPTTGTCFKQKNRITSFTCIGGTLWLGVHVDVGSDRHRPLVNPFKWFCFNLAGVGLPVRAVRSTRRDAVNVDIWFNAQDRLVLSLSRHLIPSADVGGSWSWVIYSAHF